MKLCESQNELIEYLGFQVTGRDNISIIVFEDTKDLILDFLDEYIEDEVSCCVRTTLEDEYVYIINKLTNKDGKVSLIVKPYDNEYVENDIIMIEEFAIEDLDISDVGETFDAEEVTVVGLEENHEIEKETEGDCSKCEDFECEHNCNFNNDEDNEVIEYVLEKIRQYRNDEIDAIEELCFEIYETAYNDGVSSALLGVKESIDKAIEERE